MDPAIQPLVEAIAESPAAKVDYWALDKLNKEVNSGPWRDCEWFTEAKRQKLRDMGIPATPLFVSTETTDGTKPNHVVLQVGDWILDNRKPKPYTRKQMEHGGYKVFPDYKYPDGTTSPGGKK